MSRTLLATSTLLLLSGLLAPRFAAAQQTGAASVRPVTGAKHPLGIAALHPVPRIFTLAWQGNPAAAAFAVAEQGGRTAPIRMPRRSFTLTWVESAGDSITVSTGTAAAVNGSHCTITTLVAVPCGTP